MSRSMPYAVVVSVTCALLVMSSCVNRPPDPDGTFAPLGTLQGVVVDSYDQLPIDGAKVTINYQGNSKTVTTDSTGTFSFTDIPASGNPNSSGGATGTYSVNLDLSAVSGDRKYKPFRTQQVSVQFTELRRADTTAAQTANAVQDSVPVGYLVSNVTFVVRQARATVSGKVLDEQLKARPSTTLVMVSRSNNTSVPLGAAVGSVTTGEDGAFKFTDIEEGASYQLVLADQNTVFAGGSNNYNGGNFTALELGVETILAPAVIAARPASDPTVPWVTATSPSEDQVLAPADVSKAIVIKFSEPMNTQRGLSMVTGFRRLGARNRPDDSTNTQLTIIFDKSWNTAGTELTITPTTALEAGFRYQLDFNNSLITDVAGNFRNRSVPFTSPAAPDALSISNGIDDLVFSISSDSSALTVAGVQQEPDTADNQTAGTATRASVLEADPSATESSFLTAQNAGYYTQNRTDGAYITWSAPTSPVRRYRIWTRVGMNNPILISRGNNPWGVSGSTRIDPLTPSQTAFNMPLSDLATILSNESGGFTGGLANTVWNNALEAQLGVSVVNEDGQEGDVSFVTLRDNTGPAYATNGFGMTNTWLNSNDSVRLNYSANCSTSLNNRVTCPKIANTVTGMPAATSYGQRVVTFDLSEPVDAASVIAANFDLVDGVLANNVGISNPNASGSSVEPEASISSVVPLNVNNGRTTRIAVVFNNFFGLDTGDTLVLRKSATAAVKDLVGNSAKDTRLISAPFVDDYPPFIKSVTVDPANDRMTIVYTKWFMNNQTVSDPTRGNVALGEFAFSDMRMSTSTAATSSAVLLTANKSFNGTGEAQVVLQFDDVGYIRGYNSADPNCTTNSRGTRVSTNAFTSIDFATTGARSSATQNDDGQVAYENMLVDAADPTHSPGAYEPASGIGTRSSMRDSIPPRLSNNFNDRTFATGSNALTVPASTTLGFTIDVWLTEFTDNENSATASNSALNPANWAVRAIDLGGDGWTGNSASDAAASNVTVTIQSVALIGISGAGCQRLPRYRLNLQVQNSNASAINLGFNRVALGAAMADYAGNAVGATPSHAVYGYNPTRTDSTGATSPGWVIQ